MKPVIKFAADQDCSVVDCGLNKYAWGYCVKHYARMKRRGTTKPFTIQDRFWSKVRKTADCWFWEGYKTEKGYGIAYDGVRNLGAHRVAYKWERGAIPSNMQLDHTCHTEAVRRGECKGGNTCVHRSCVNPSHLEPVSGKVNWERGLQVQRTKERAASRTTCHRGHEYNESNTRFTKTKTGILRQCRICESERRRKK